ncbi:neurogenic locus notch homolog protein 2-like isoform X2 [Dendronephthya gigantea]|uniref:neurogenic locus notch homolog protein 2-like isoform X2 n=1 Tax=Dendronephthya gigantea TaxID=151771 RepID=UPI00106D3329|nr:neurogenic locus notch homolog protein 2-like isoform X2 [Dendronephthya gigantea]
MKILAIFVLVSVLYLPIVTGYGRAKEGKCPSLKGNENCAEKLLNSEYNATVCHGQDIECPGDEKCCDDGCGDYECRPAIGLPPLPDIEPRCLSAEIGVGDQCESANITYCQANQCKKCCVHNSVCSPSSDYITKDECEKKLCKGILCPGQGEVCQLDKYHRATCDCPVECPPNSGSSPVCGSDGITYENKCEMDMTACVTGERIDVVNQGVCLPPTPKGPLEICSMPKDKGFGWTVELRYTFNKAEGVCEAFIYHGKGGNENNFNRFKDCEDFCSDTVTDVCRLPKLVGPCRAAMPRWYFNSRVQRCERFTFGGCLGNRNNFENKKSCQNQCICSLPKAPGPCLGYFPSWFYNTETGRCEEFTYGGCVGNMNRFYNEERCETVCGRAQVKPSGVDLTPRCNDASKFNCRTIKKCISASLKCNGKDDCGDNSDEEGCDPCANMKCDFYSKCVTTKNNTAICDCPKICPSDWRPVCASDNETYPNLCMMKVRSCENQVELTKVRYGECNAREYTKCELERTEGEQKLLVGIYIPQCEEDGSYSKTQCHGSTGYCWCVDVEGNKLEGTETRLWPNCTKEPPPTEAPINICDITLCEFGRCFVVDGHATCRCQYVCPLIYEPVCGSDNESYPNLCVMESRACEMKKHIRKQYNGNCEPPPTNEPINICDTISCEFGRCTVVDGKAVCKCRPGCPRIYSPVCGSDNETYSNPCEMKSRACEMKKHIELQYTGKCAGGRGVNTITLKTGDPCEDFVCDFYASCIPLRNGSRVCECPQICTREYAPVCGSNNVTYGNLCGLKVASCENKELITKQYDGACGAKPKSKCEKERDAMLNPLLVGVFTPQCEEDGSYSKMQCHGSTGYCWCVNADGSKLKGTETRSRPNCTEEAKPKSKCEKERDAFLNRPPLLGAFTPQCEEDGSYSKMQCHGSTGYCWCVDVDGSKLEGTETRSRPNCTEEAKPKSKCEKERDDVLNGPPLVGAFTPQCEEDGSYSKMQCHGSTGYCWCVDADGSKLEGTETRSRINCTEVLPPTDPPFDICDISLCEFGRCVNVNGTATCVCNKACPLIERPVCASDNKTYSNLCVMESEACERKEHIRVKHDGPCLLPPTDPPFDICDISLCEFGRCVNVNGTATCVCNKACPFIERPVCASDNKTYSNLCVMESEACERKEHIRVKHDGPCRTESKCQKELAHVLSLAERQRAGMLKPSCEEDGSYSPKQCHKSSAYCWCVTRWGKKIPRTQVRFIQPNCSQAATIDPCVDVKCDFHASCVPMENGEHICECPQFCTKEYSPVCATDGHTYDNECYMDMESCLNKELLFVESRGECKPPSTKGPPLDPCSISLCDFGRCVVVNGTATCVCKNACPFIEEPVCASDNKTYANLCVMEAEACERKEHLTVQYDGPCDDLEALPKANNPCELTECRFYSKCVVINGSAECVCDKGCTRELDLKCGSDNITYDNLCKLKRASCEDMREINVVNDGECVVKKDALTTVASAKALPKCKNCPKSGKQNVVKSFCDWYNKFVIVGEIVNASESGREITVKVETKYKPRAEKTKFRPKNIVNILVQKPPTCSCDNMEFRKNDRYVLMGQKSRRRKTFVIKWKTGFVEKVSKPLIEKLKKRSKSWGFCAKQFGKRRQ